MDPHDSGSAPSSTTTRLDGWKDIANYLGRNIRTVQRWERELQLPVRRLSSSKGASVFATRAEVDAWLSSRSLTELASIDADSDTFPAVDSLEEPEKKQPRPHPLKLVAYLGLIVVLAIIAIGAIRLLHSRPPSNYRIEGNAFIVFDAEGRELWRKTFAALEIPNGHRKHVWIGDIEGDGSDEILFEYHSGGELDHSALYCFSAKGKLLWQFTPGHTVRTADAIFEPPFSIQSFEVVSDFDRSFVVVSSTHYRHFPDQVAVLSPSGKLVGEYWHSGLISHIASADMNHDGVTELYLSGMDAQYHMATMVMLNLREASGASAETNPHYQLSDMPIAKERSRVFFRRTCINLAQEPYNLASDIRFEKDTIWVSVAEQLYSDATSPGIAYVDYDLTPNLDLQGVSVPDSFSVIHKQLEKRHLLDHTFSSQELEPLKNIKQP